MQDKLTKLMMLTMSSYDGEALNALRKANAILAERDLTWEEILSAERLRRRSRAERTRSPEIDLMFQTLFNTVQGPFMKFVADVYKFYNHNGYLTAKQYDAIKAAYQREAA